MEQRTEKQGTYKGSVTVFAALSIMLVAQLLFTLIEGARLTEFKKIAQMNTESVAESVFADFCSPLWEEYRILSLTATNQDGELSMNNRAAQMRTLSLENIGDQDGRSIKLQGMNLFHADIEDVEIMDYQLMTDGDGTVFAQAVTAYMKENLAYELAKGIYNNYESIKALRDQYGDGSDQMSGALNALEEAKREREEQKRQEELAKEAQRKEKEEQKKKKKSKSKSKTSLQVQSEPSTGEVALDNPVTTVMEAQKKGSLGLVLPPEANLSSASLSGTDRVSLRDRAQGTAQVSDQGDWYDKTLCAQYVCNYLSCYTKQMESHAINYEMEYLIGGKENDADNLRAMADRLLLIREGLNMASLMASSTKQAEALTLATALAGATVNPLIIEAVKYGILAAWAYVESVLDVRTLLDGGRIPLMKSDATWTSSVENFPSLLSGWSKAKSCDNGGLDYKQYGETLLLFEGEKTLAMRIMDLEEATVRAIEGYEKFRMDHAISAMRVQITYAYRPVFLGFVSLAQSSSDHYRIMDDAAYSYTTGKEGV